VNTQVFDDIPIFLVLAAMSGFLAVAFLLFAVWPNPKWLRDLKRRRGRSYDGANSADKNIGVYAKNALTALVVLGVALVVATILVFGMNFPIVLAVATALIFVSMVVPMVNEVKAKRERKAARRDALAITEYVSGRMGSQATLFTALETLVEEIRSGKREMLCGDDLQEAVQQVRLGRDMGDEMRILADKYREINELRFVFSNYAVLSDSAMGQDAQLQHADDVTSSVVLMDELAGTIETEMTTATMTRYAMFVLIGGMIAFVLIGGGELSTALTQTTPGNVILIMSFLALWFAQYVGTRLERVPNVEF
jgi:uncharacterized membrane protein